MERHRTIPRFGMVAALSGFALAACFSHEPAQAAAADFFKGQTVRVVVGYSPGGGYDAYARMITPELEKRLGATVIVENKTGGAGLTALNSLVREKPDGLRMMLVNGEGAVLAQLVDRPGTRFDMLKIGILGRVSYENRMLIAAAGTPFAKIDGFFSAKDPVKFGSGGRIDSMGDAASIFCRATNVPCKLITGYKGSSEVSLALLRGEVNAQVTSESQTAKLVKGGKIVAVAVLAPNTAPLLPQAKSIFDLVKLTPEQDKWLRFRAGVSDVGRTLVVPDGLPAERLALLRKAVREIMTDKNFVAAAEKARRPIAYAPPEESENIIKGIFAKLSAKERTDIKELLLKAY